MSRSAGVHCRVLGPVQVTVTGADAPPELLWRKHVALLVYLARSPRRRRTREHLVGLLWSDRDEKQARHSLSEALRVFRRVLGDDQVQADVARHAPGSMLILADFTGAEFDKDVAQKIKKVLVLDRPYVKRSAWIGTESLPHVFYENFKTFSQRELPIFKTREEALEWLVTE